MASVFSLFGELGLDTKNYAASLRYADNRLKASERLFLESEKIKERAAAASALLQQKLAAQTAAVQDRLAVAREGIAQRQAQFEERMAVQAANKIEAEQKKMAAAAQRAAEVSQFSWQRLGDGISSVGKGMQSVGTALTLGVTAPLTAVGAMAIKSAVDFDTLRTQLTAATGSTDAANAKFKELNQLAQANAGVLTKGAVATYNFLKPLGFAEGTINEVIKAFGKLKSANPDVDLGRMATNLGQLFDQGFEQQDFKELLGNFPRAGEILKKAFALTSGSTDRKGIAEEMKKLIKNGLSKEDLFAAFAQGINADAFLSKVTDPVAVRFEKLTERILLALEPIGILILGAMEKVLPPITAFIERLSLGFQSLSPTMQVVVVALAGLAAAAGPALFVLGSIITTIGSLVASAGAIGIVVAVLAGIGTALLPVIAIAAFFYQAWVNNWELAKQVFNDGVAYVTGVVNSGLAMLTQFWTDHGTAIMAYLSSWWNTLAEFIAGVMEIVSSYVKLGLQILQGDWSGAWETILQITTQVWTVITQLITNALATVGQLIQAFLPIFIQGFKWAMTTLLELVGKAIAYVVYFVATLPQQLIKLIPQIIAAGMQIGSAIWEGIKQGFSGGGGGSGAINNPAGPVDMFSNLIDSFKSMYNSVMPSGTAPTVSTPTILTTLNTDAIKTATSLDKVTEKLDKVKKAAKTPKVPQISDATMRAAEKVGMEAQKKAAEDAKNAGKIFATMTGKDGKQRKIWSQDTMLSSYVPTIPPGSQANMASDIDALERVAKAAAEGVLHIQIDDPMNKTTYGGSSANVAARYNKR